MVEKSGLEEVREMLLSAMKQVRDGTIDIDRASTLRDLGQTLINSAKVEVDYLRATDSINATGFIIQDDDKKRPALPSPHLGRLPRTASRP